MSGVHSTSARTGTRATPGYSGKPLWQKLGLKAGRRVWLRHAPAQYWAWCGFDAADVELAGASARRFDFGHVFVTTRNWSGKLPPPRAGSKRAACCGFPGRRSPPA